jgi:hypothetical protein
MASFMGRKIKRILILNMISDKNSESGYYPILDRRYCNRFCGMGKVCIDFAHHSKLFKCLLSLFPNGSRSIGGSYFKINLIKSYT